VTTIRYLAPSLVSLLCAITLAAPLASTAADAGILHTHDSSGAPEDARKAVLIGRIKQMLSHGDFLDVAYTGKIFGFRPDQLTPLTSLAVATSHFEFQIDDINHTGTSVTLSSSDAAPYGVTYVQTLADRTSRAPEIRSVDIFVVPSKDKICITRNDLRSLFDSGRTDNRAFNQPHRYVSLRSARQEAPRGKCVCLSNAQSALRRTHEIVRDVGQCADHFPTDGKLTN